MINGDCQRKEPFDGNLRETTFKMKKAVFCDVAPCRSRVNPNLEEIAFFIVSAVKTSNLTFKISDILSQDLLIYFH